MSDFVLNSSFSPGSVPSASPAALDFHRALPGYRPTPLHRLELPGLPGPTWLKDESDRFGLPAFKILGASWAVEQTLRQQPGVTVLVAASAGNHGRAVARAAAWRGLTAEIHLPAGTGAGRSAAIRAEGATVIMVDGNYDRAVESAFASADRPGAALIADTSTVPVAGPPDWVIDGYGTLFAELSAQLDQPVDLVLVPTGVGSFAAAAVRWAVHQQPSARVVAVEPAAAPCISASLSASHPITVPTPGTSLAGLDCATPSAVAWPTLIAGLSGSITVDDQSVHRAMRDLAAAGMTIGDCGAATVTAARALFAEESGADLLRCMALGTNPQILCLGTEGASDPTGYRNRIGVPG